MAVDAASPIQEGRVDDRPIARGVPDQDPESHDPGDPGGQNPAYHDQVQMRTLLAGPLPLLVASVGTQGRSAQLRTAVATAGLDPLSSFIGAELPQGARVGFVLEGPEIRLVDEHENTLLRADRAGLDADWLRAALDRKGTMFLVVGNMDLAEHEPAAELAQRLDAQARAGHAIGAVVGVVEERPKLPLLFGSA